MSEFEIRTEIEKQDYPHGEVTDWPVSVVYEMDGGVHISSVTSLMGWKITHNPKPIPDRSDDWDFIHDDYDGENGLCGTAASEEKAWEQIVDIAWDHFGDITESLADYQIGQVEQACIDHYADMCDYAQAHAEDMAAARAEARMEIMQEELAMRDSQRGRKIWA